MIAWKAGLEHTPSGKAREIPQKHVWSSGIFITKDGSIHRRFFNKITGKWRWERRMEFVEDGDGRQGLHLPNFIPVETLICMAWRRRSPESVTQTRVVEGRYPVAKYLRWIEEANEDHLQYMNEEWKPLKWKCGMVPCSSRYEISNYSRLKDPDGNITRGHWCYGHQWAAVKGCGLVNLTQSSRGRREAFIESHILDAANMLMTGHTPRQHSHEKDVAEQTSWNYFTKAAKFIGGVDLRRMVEGIVDAKLWRILKRMKRRDDPLLGGKLIPLYEEIKSEYEEFSTVRYSWEQLRLARMSLLA